MEKNKQKQLNSACEYFSQQEYQTQFFLVLAMPQFQKVSRVKWVEMSSLAKFR